MRRRSVRMTRSRLASVAAGLVTSAALLTIPASPADAGAPTATGQPASAAAGGASSTAGGFGLPQGSLPTTSTQQSSLSAADSTGSTGGCAGYATNVGAGIYCYGGETGGPPVPLIEQFPGQDYHPCRVYDVPTGMKAPRNQTPDKGRWYLQSCIDGIDWHDPYGGSPRVTLSFVYVNNDEDDPTEWNPTELDDFLWAQVRQNYPVPFVTAWPTHIPRVGTPTWFQFRWLNEDLEAATQGPYAGNENGGPYLELTYGDVTLRAQSESVRVVPQIEGMGAAECGAVPKAYDQAAEPTLEAQNNPCHVVFRHSSAAAEELTPDDVPLPETSADYPIPMFVLNIEVDWHVTMTGGQGDDLGTHTFTAYQQIPVSEVTGLVGQEL